MAEIFHSMIYDGPKAEKRVEITGRLEPIAFKLGPLSEQPGPLFGKKYADVTEKEGRALVRRAPALFKWPEGTQLGPQIVSRDEFAAALDRIAALEALLAAEPEAPKKKGKKPAAEAAAESEAPAPVSTMVDTPPADPEAPPAEEVTP